MKAHNNLSERAIVETVARYVGRDVDAADDFSDDIGLDSIDRLNLMATVEKEHDVYLSDEALSSVSNLRDLLKALEVESAGRPQ
jgi:acyl carrier protein